MLLWLATLAYQDLVLLSNSAVIMELATILATGVSPLPHSKAMLTDSLSINALLGSLERGLSKVGNRQEWGSSPIRVWGGSDEQAAKT
jgi:hypothetical protein